MHIYRSKVYQNRENVFYPDEFEINSIKDLKEATRLDYMPGKTNGRRCNENVIYCDFIYHDYDNDFSENCADWITIDKARDEIYKGIRAYFISSRNHQKEKDGKPARPRFHVFLPTRQFNPKQYEKYLPAFKEWFPLIDNDALDPARFFYGHTTPEIYYQDGIDILEWAKAKRALEIGESEEFEIPGYNEPKEKITEGARNGALKSYAGHIKLDFLDKEKEELFNALWKWNVEKCEPPISEKEVRSTVLKSTWKDIQKINSAREYEHRENTVKIEYKFNDVGTAEFLRDTIGKGLRFCDDKKSWMYFLDGVWKRDNLHKVHKRARAAFRVWGKNVFKLKDDIQRGQGLSWLGKLTSYETCERVIKETRHHLSITPDDFDTNDHLLNFKNGTLNLLTKQFYEHRREEYHTKITNCNYDESAKPSKLWLDFIDLIFENNQEMISYIQKIMGLSLIGKNGREEFFIFHGKGKNGKSQFIAVFQDIFGSYCDSLSPEKIMESRIANNDTYIATLRDARALFCSESKESAFLDVSFVKKLTDQSQAFKVAQKYEKPQIFNFKLTPFLITNNKPVITETSDGTWRRIKMIPFKYQVPEEKKILKYAEVLKESGIEGICNWFLEGFYKSREDGVKEPEIVTSATTQYKVSSDGIQKFIDECCETGKDKKENRHALKKAFLNYAGLTKYRSFEDKMNEKGFPSKHSNGEYYFYIKLKPEAEKDSYV
jgi:putative DNA primase/helicase